MDDVKNEEKPCKKKKRKEQNSNPYDNFYLIWVVLREYASRDNPLTAGAVFEIMKKTQESYPSAETVSRLLRERLELVNDIFACRVLPSVSTVRNVLRKQGDSSKIIEDTVRIGCLAKIKKNQYEDHFDYCERLAEKKGVDELPSESIPTRYYYLESPLSDGEWKILTDLIRFAPWISSEQSTHFLKVIHQLGGLHSWGDEVKYAFKRENKEQFDIINTLDRGIQENKKVSIRYGTHVLRSIGQLNTPTLEQREKNGTMVITPLSLIWSNGNYYVVTRYDEKGTMHLRVDRILKATLTQQTFTPEDNFSVVEHRDRSPMMYGGDPKRVRFSCPCTLLDKVLDVFGKTPYYQLDKSDDKKIIVTVQASHSGVILFALQRLDEVEILDPPELREEIQKILEKNLGKYKSS